MRAALLIGALALPLLAYACRDAVEPFPPVDRTDPPDPSLIQLTYSPGDDRTPVWSANGDSVYYTALHWDGNPAAPATLLAMPASGDAPARELLTNVQVGIHVGAWIGAPALAAGGADVAFVRLRLLNDRPCAGERVCPLDMSETLSMVRLTVGELHARAIDSEASIQDDVVLPLAFEGHSQVVDPSAPGGFLTISEYHPFQLEFEMNGRAIFRPSWNPEGTELVVSDGLRLLRSQLGAVSAVEIPGTTDGVSPAWSPDGEWIAYTRHERLGTETLTCSYFGPDGIQCSEQRIFHTLSVPTIVLTRPDGSEEIVLGAGADPAWAPDGSAVYAATIAAGIRRMPIDGSASELIEGTTLGVEPAVSPDGRRLAFSRRWAGPTVSHDIWIVDLP